MKPYDEEQEKRMQRVNSANEAQTNYIQKIIKEEKRRWFIKAALMLLSLAVLLVLLLFLSGCGKTAIEDPDIEAVDEMVYAFIVGKVEGNDDLLAEVLAPDAEGILRSGRHAYPGHADEMGERFEITRYANEYENGSLFYKVKFYRPSTGKTSTYNVLAVHTEEGWRIAKNASISAEIMAIGIKDEEGEVVHEWKE